MNSIKEILLSKTKFDLEENKEKFIQSFVQLYQLEILRPSLNLIITKLKHNDAEFIIEVSKVWNRLAGHCTTTGFFEKIKDIFFHRKKYCVSIKTITPDVIIHEMAHAVDQEMELDLNAEFRFVLGEDMKNKVSSHPHVADAVRSVMRDELKGYDFKNIMEELFARYFELLAMSYECGGYGRFHFRYGDIVRYFVKTTEWVEKILNPKILEKIDSDVTEYSEKLVEELEPYKKKWSEETAKSIYNKTMRKGAVGKWSGITKSDADWQKSYEEYVSKRSQKIEE
ncbi:hypothetical protein ACFL0U_01490 [Pseudomonadota bacterium]